MLHLQRYREENRGAVREAFRTIFDNSELTYFDESGFDGPSIIGLDSDGVVQAFILVDNSDPEGFTDCEITYLGVTPPFRRHGYAKRLIRTVQEVGKGRGIWLKVLETNKAAIRLYTDVGFVVGERYDTANGRGLTLVWGVAYECARCSAALDPSTVLWNAKIEPVCRDCQSG